MPAVNAAIFILTQNNDVRRTYLKTCLYFLFRHMNAETKYPVVILHEGDYDTKHQREILMGIRASCRSLVSFRALDPEDFVLPPHIDKEKLDKCIDTRPTPYWRNDKYRMMCRWWLVHFPKYAQGYDYVMRLDDDSFIEEQVPDLFLWMHNKNLVYASNILHVDCGLCCYGMKEFFDKNYSDAKSQQRLAGAFVAQEVPMRSVQFHPFRSLLSITQDPLPEIGENMTLYMPVMHYNNFFVTKTEFWNRPDVKDAIKKIDENGSIFYFRWGDAPLQSLLVLLHAEPNEQSRSIFRYSKRMQREAFLGDDKEYHSYMPATYDKSSCVTENKK